MSDINPVSRPSVAALNSYGKPSAKSEPVNGQPRPTDQAEFSNNARLMSLMNDMPDVREDLVARVKSEIEAGTYETPDKIDALLDNLAEDLV